MHPLGVGRHDAATTPVSYRANGPDGRGFVSHTSDYASTRKSGGHLLTKVAALILA